MKSTGRFERAARIALSGLLVLPQAVAPATITVQGGCTLPDAITAANRDAATGACRAGAGADTLVLTGDVRLAVVDNPDNGLPQISSKITIRGNGFTIERTPSAPRFRILDVAQSGDLTLEDVTVSNGSLSSARGAGIRTYGDLTLKNSSVTGNETNDRGGGIFVRGLSYAEPYPEVSLVNTSVSGNSARRGAGITAYAYSSLTLTGSTISDNVARARGGGLLFYNGSATITSSTISGNSAASGAGLRAAFYSYLTITDTTISDNQARLEGGGMFARYSGITLERSRVVNNSASRGGGIYSGTGYAELDVNSSTLSGNMATQAGGGAFLIAITGEVTVTLRNSTVSGNSAPSGGGIYLYHYYYRNEGSFTHSTITQNAASMGAGIYFKNPSTYYHLLADSVIAGNVGPNCTGDGFTDGGNNFDDDGSCGSAAAITPGVDFDTQLADNGGPTPTHALLGGSVAIDASGECGLETDQRGFPREGLCDSGSFEFGAEALGSSVTGVSHRKVICKNLTTGQSRRRRTNATSWLCEDLGVSADPGDRVRLTSSGVVTGAASVGGSISGLAEGNSPRVICRNRSSGEKVSFSSTSQSWDCEAEGLAVSPGDSVRQKIRGKV